MYHSVLQRLFWPVFNSQEERDLYFSGTGFSIQENKKLFVFKGGLVNFNSYFNAFPLKVFLEKTSIDDIEVKLHLLKGKGVLRIFGQNLNGKTLILEKMIDGAFSGVNIPFDIISNKYATLFVEFMAYEDSIISGVEYVTYTEKKREIYLGIVTTTFNRQEQVLNLIKKLSDNDELLSHTKLYVINNGEDIPFSGNDFVTVVKNENTGGSGGFMTGLLNSQERNHTHTMFIDDDALCHPESIVKAISFLSYALDPNTSLGGAMLYEKKPYIQYEAGAKIQGFNLVPRNMNMDLRYESNHFFNNFVESADYGPWWFFIFPNIQGLKFSFPFFVRGDDVTFSLRNKFKPIMLNGLCSWQESFDAKISPTVEYLAFRSFLMINIVYSERLSSAFSLFINIHKRILFELLGFKYTIASALNESIKDVLIGPDFWKKNIKMATRLKEISDKAGSIESISVSGYDFRSSGIGYGLKKKFLVALTLGGNLLPLAVNKGRKYIYGMTANPYASLRTQEIVYFSPELEKGFLVRRNRPLFWKLFLKSIYLSAKITFKRKKLRKLYLSSLTTFESKDFWEGK
ncbi:glycosyltransferase [Kluyvera genomosp. 3]|uniref:Glycosyltransferase family 2 protein n=1 Tax=Kluyvera genomosp. 3 TaxID=2774055 RepID=A0A6G9RIW4_9ENTR|nr:glycosyltransferase [Kluyvera genomosp. 3]QIR26850.1 glycosyltransferase family 2 protein [Kluyvera genomosp. 3]